MASVGCRAQVASVGRRAPMASVGCRAAVAGVGCRAVIAGVGCRAAVAGVGRRALVAGVGVCAFVMFQNKINTRLDKAWQIQLRTDPQSARAILDVIISLRIIQCFDLGEFIQIAVFVGRRIKTPDIKRIRAKVHAGFADFRLRLGEFGVFLILFATADHAGAETFVTFHRFPLILFSLPPPPSRLYQKL